MQKFKLSTEYIELFKLLKVTNLCNSGGEAKHFIAEGLVKVDNLIETRKACKIRAGQIVSFNRNRVLVEGDPVATDLNTDENIDTDQDQI